MQHYKYSVFKRFYNSPEIGQIRMFFSANIKTLFTYPKSVWYSQRYNSGEKFILNNASLYPNKYNDIHRDSFYDSEPVGLSTRALTNLNELGLLRYLNRLNFNSESEIRKNTALLNESLNHVVGELVNIFKYSQGNINIPAAVSARTLYAVAKNSDYNFSSRLALDEETSNMIIEKFIEKLDFADADSISNVLYFLAKQNNWNNDTWSRLLSALRSKDFLPDFTQVELKPPFLFRYKEKDDAAWNEVDELGQNLYFKGYKAVFELNWALGEAERNNVNVSDIRTDINNRFVYLRENFDSYLARI